MKPKTAGILVFVVFAQLALGSDVAPVPEIDATTVGSALTLVTGALVVLRARRNR